MLNEKKSAQNLSEMSVCQLSSFKVTEQMCETSFNSTLLTACSNSKCWNATDLPSYILLLIDVLQTGIRQTDTHGETVWIKMKEREK